MNNIKAFFNFILLVSLLASCAPQAVSDLTATPQEPTQTAVPPTATLTSTPLPTETPLPTDTPSATAPSCAVPLNPTDNATVPAQGPFDFTWTAFAGAASYVVSIGPADWFATNFPVNGTALTRYMETFPSSPSYQWSIAALNASGQTLCTGGPYKFVTSKDMFATPSFAGGAIVQPTAAVAVEPALQESNAPVDTGSDDSAIKINSVSFMDGSCDVTVTYSVTSANHIDQAIVRYTRDPDEANSGDFCMYGYATNLWPSSPTTYGADFDLSSWRFPFQNGDIIYLMAKFFDSQGRVECSQVVEHTITTACTDN